jgi:hypothetical protein
MSCHRKIADELLLGLLYDTHTKDLCCFPDLDFELLNDEEFELGSQDADARPYMSLINLNGKRRFSLFLVSRQF